MKLIKSPLGTLYGARSGDKGGCANLGVWAKTDLAYSFLFNFLTVDKAQRITARSQTIMKSIDMIFQILSP